MTANRQQLIYEFLVGAAIQEANKLHGRQPRRTIKPLLQELGRAAAYTAANEDAVKVETGKCKVTFNLSGSELLGDTILIHLARVIPEDLTNDTTRLLGQLFLMPAAARQAAGRTHTQDGSRLERGAMALLVTYGRGLHEKMQREGRTPNWEEFAEELTVALDEQFRRAAMGGLPNWPLRDKDTNKPKRVPSATLSNYLHNPRKLPLGLPGKPSDLRRRAGRKARGTSR